LDSILIGVVAGLVTTIFVVVFRSIWIKILVPWFENMVYKDAIIEGTWKSSYEDENYGTEIVMINQPSHKVYGTMTTLSGPD
jgi:hypothetical protein